MYAHLETKEANLGTIHVFVLSAFPTTCGKTCGVIIKDIITRTLLLYFHDKLVLLSCL